MHGSPSMSHILLQPTYKHSTDTSRMPMKAERVSTGIFLSLKTHLISSASLSGNKKSTNQRNTCLSEPDYFHNLKLSMQATTIIF
jgi:hypothetical protein